jgi:uncharacterized protein with von Willebrand factor type A (vWA) domain
MSAALAFPHAGGSEPGASMRRRLAGFIATLRGAGFAIGHAEAADAARLLASPAADRPETLRAGLRALFSSRQSELARFDELFAAFWRGLGVRQEMRVAARGQTKTPHSLSAGPGGTSPQDALPERSLGGAPVDGAAEGRGRRGGASAREALSAKDLRKLAGPGEMAAAIALAERLARRMRARLTRRDHVRKRGRRIDLRATIRRNIGHGGEPFDLAFRRRKTKPLRLVVLLDASGSMELYTGFFVRFLHAVALAFKQSEAFLFHTRLAHVSSALRERDPARALDRLSLMAQGVGGGTRIGESLATFNRWHARRVIHSRTCVMILSDGYDTGAPEMLAAAMQALRKRCRRIVWLNPLIGWEGYEPSARGMRAALPHVDLFAAAHNIDSLAALEPYLARI